MSKSGNDHARVADALSEEGPMTRLLIAAAAKVRGGRNWSDLTPAELRAARRRLTRVWERQCWEAERADPLWRRDANGKWEYDHTRTTARRVDLMHALSVGEVRPNVTTWRWANENKRVVDDALPFDADGRRC